VGKSIALGGWSFFQEQKQKMPVYLINHSLVQIGSINSWKLFKNYFSLEISLYDRCLWVSWLVCLTIQSTPPLERVVSIISNFELTVGWVPFWSIFLENNLSDYLIPLGWAFLTVLLNLNRLNLRYPLGWLVSTFGFDY